MACTFIIMSSILPFFFCAGVFFNGSSKAEIEMHIILFLRPEWPFDTLIAIMERIRWRVGDVFLLPVPLRVSTYLSIYAAPYAVPCIQTSACLHAAPVM